MRKIIFIIVLILVPFTTLVIAKVNDAQPIVLSYPVSMPVSFPEVKLMDFTVFNGNLSIKNNKIRKRDAKLSNTKTFISYIKREESTATLRIRDIISDKDIDMVSLKSQFKYVLGWSTNDKYILLA